MWPITLSGRLPIVDLVGRYLTNYLMGRELTPHRNSFTPVPCGTVVLCGISTCFQVLSPCVGQIAHALLTRPPLKSNLPYRSASNLISARLACVKHAASVRPEPGSNSYVQSLSSSLPNSRSLAKAPARPVLQRRFTLSESDCSFSDLLFTVSFSRIVRRRSRGDMLYYTCFTSQSQAIFPTLSPLNAKILFHVQ